MTTTKTHKPAATPTISLVRAPIACCDILPAGLPGIVTIGDEVYALAYIQSGNEILGYHLRKAGSLESAYDVPADLSNCGCLGFLRWGRCKHITAMRCVRETGRVA